MANLESIRRSYRVEPDWENLPEHTNSLEGISRQVQRLRFRREKNSHRGLREFRELKELVIFCPNQEAIDEIAHLQNLEFLYIDDTRAKDLAALTGCRSLRHLTIKGATQVTELNWVVDLPPLESLAIENFKKITDISPLGNLKSLKAVGVEGSIWATQKVVTFAPLSELLNLEAAFITNCRPQRDGLSPLHALKQLQFLEAPAFYKEAEFAELQAKLPELSCNWFDLIGEHGTIKKAISAVTNRGA